jgi:hypothetical protein
VRTFILENRVKGAGWLVLVGLYVALRTMI